MSQAKFYPFQLSLMQVRMIPRRKSEDLQILLVLNGSIHLEVDNRLYELQADDIVVINPQESYQISSEKNNQFLYLRIPSKTVIQFLKENWFPYFDCCSLETKNENLFQQLREYLAHLMAAYFRQEDGIELEVYQYLFTIVSHLFKHFKKDIIQSFSALKETTDQRLKRIVSKIHSEYDQFISLEEMALEEHLSYYYLSRLFKQEVGMTFTEYLNQIRLRHAVEELIYTSHSVTKIAFNHGFTNVKSFHQVFKKQYHTTPAIYRKQNNKHKSFEQTPTTKEEYQEIVGERALQELAKYLVEKDIDDENTAIKQVLQLDAAKEQHETYQSAQKIIKIGTALEGLTKGVQKELRILQKEVSFDFIQFEGFCPETNFVNNVHMISEYIRNNQLFDFLVEISLRPMIQLKPPKNLQTDGWQQWCQNQLEILRHFLNRYGKSEIERWKIEWLPMNKFWDSNDFDMYHFFYCAFKQLLSTGKIGICGLNSLQEQELLHYQSLIQQQKKYHCLPDFVTFSADPYQSSSVRKKHAAGFKAYQQDILAQVTQVVSDVRADSQFYAWQPEVFLTEWNTLVGEGNTLAGTFFRSALIIESVIELSQDVTGIAFWLNIKVKERQTKLREDSSLSVFLYDQLRRPLFFSLKFLNDLNGYLLAKGSDFLFTRNGEYYCLLVYNSSYLNPLYSVDSYQVQYQSKKLNIYLDAIPTGNYLLRHYVLDKDHGGIYNDWIRVGGQAEIDQELQQYLEQKILPKFELSEINITKETVHLETILTLNACQLYIFQPIY